MNSNEFQAVPLKNLGCTCFINSTIQALLSLPELVELMEIHRGDELPADGIMFSLLTAELIKISKLKQTTAYSLDRSLARNIYRKLEAECWTQQDVSELLAKIFEQVQMYAPSIYEMVFVRIRDACKTKYLSDSHTLTYYVDPCQKGFNVNDELRKVVHIDNEFQYCQCNTDVVHIVGPLPQMLFLTVLRYTNEFRVRNDLKLEFEVIVDLCGSAYELVATINYHGQTNKGGGNVPTKCTSDENPGFLKKLRKTLSSTSEESSSASVETSIPTIYLESAQPAAQWCGEKGHWYSYGKRGNIWYLFNDHEVLKMKRLVTNEAVILVFRKINKLDQNKNVL